MKICAIQIQPLSEDLHGSIHKHQDWIEASAEQNADFVLFPELSLTGYEPAQAKRLAIDLNDKKLDPFQTLSDKYHLNIAVGAPLKASNSVYIASVIFSPHASRRSYLKGYLHPDEEPFFLPGHTQPVMTLGGHPIAFSICYEISIPDHLRQVMQHAPHAYTASVAKFKKGIDSAIERLSIIARSNSLSTIMANSVGLADGGICAGRTTAWNQQGKILEQLNEGEEGGILLDLDSSTALKITL